MRRALFAFFFGLVLAAGCNPVVNDAVNNLGGEAKGVPRGPLHRPGQACNLCHDGALGDPPEFSVSGTVFNTVDATTPLSNATISLTGVDGAKYSTTTNAAGNFYITPRDFQPIYPMKVSVTSNGTTVAMQSHVGENGACAGCHVDPAGPDSPGHVYFVIGGDGGVP